MTKSIYANYKAIPQGFSSTNRSIKAGFNKYLYLMPFTLEAWHGRIRACRGMGAFFPEETVAKFDDELVSELQFVANEKYIMPNAITVKIYGISMQ